MSHGCQEKGSGPMAHIVPQANVEVINLFTAFTEEGPVASVNQKITRRNVYRPVKFVGITDESDFQFCLLACKNELQSFRMSVAVFDYMASLFIPSCSLRISQTLRSL
jgi:hypothetical protein